MRIAYLAHFYAPSSCGGAGYYTALLAEGFRQSGDQVSVLCTAHWGEGRRYSNGSVDEVYNGVPVRRLYVNWQKAPRPFDWLYDSPVLGEQAQAYLEEFRPDIVHVGSCYTLSTRPVRVAKAMGLPVVLHLHDYWTICARLTLLHKDNTVCAGPVDGWCCQKCLLNGTKVWQLTSSIMTDSLQRRLFEALAQIPWFCRQDGLRGMLGDLGLRRQLTSGAMDMADILITPSDFARTLLESNGAPSGRILVMPNGNRVDWVTGVRRTPSGYLRVGFLGNVMPIKGVHLLIEAYMSLAARDQVQLQIWGDTCLAAEYCERLREYAPQEVIWGGRYDRHDLARIVSNLDVVVVPSIWYETQGIVVQEAFAAGLPAIVSDQTSLTESVMDGYNGLHFRRGSAEDLARQINRLLAEPELLERLRAGIAPVRAISEDIDQLRHIYTRLTKQADHRNPKVSGR